MGAEEPVRQRRKDSGARRENGLRVNPLLPGRLLGRRRCGKEASLK